MNSAILDTSVVIKWLHRENEEDVDKALLLREAYLHGALDVSIPDLLIYEFSNFLRYRSGLKPAEIMDLARGFWSFGFNVYPVTEAMTQSMLELALEHEISVYDAAFVALANRLSSSLVTADRALYKKVRDRHAVMLLADIIE